MYNTFMTRLANFLPLYPVLICISFGFSLVFSYGWFVNASFAKPKIIEALRGESIPAHADATRTNSRLSADSTSHPGNSGSAHSARQDSITRTLKYIFTVDLSTVTTLLLAVTSIAITAGLVRVYSFKKNTGSAQSPGQGGSIRQLWTGLSAPYFPFWHSYKNNFIYLGLLGTLFAFIIAFSQAQEGTALAKVSPVQEQTPAADSAETLYGPADILLFALGTALWSSFSAITLSLLPVTGIFRHFFISRIAPERPEDAGSAEEIDEIMDRLTEKAGRAGSSFDVLARSSLKLAQNMDQASMNSIMERLDLLRSEVRTLQESTVRKPELDSRIRDVDASLTASIDACTQEIQSLKNNLSQLAGTVEESGTRHDERIALNRQDLQELNRRIDELLAKIRELFS